LTDITSCSNKSKIA